MKRYPGLYILFIAAAIICGLLSFNYYSLASEAKLRVHFIAVGYGDAILIELPNSTVILIDAGPKESVKKLMDYLSVHHIERIHVAIITHPHKNHFEGFRKILSKIPIDRVLTNGDPQAEEGYAELMQSFQEKSIPIERIRRDSIVKNLPEGMVIRFLNPIYLDKSANDNSLVTWIQFKNTSFLFTADIGKTVQDEIIKNFPEIKNVQCVQIPHHGDSLSDSFRQGFLNAFYIMSTGKNKWGLPRKEDLLKIKDSLFWRTDKDGTIDMESDGQIIRVNKK